MEIFEEFFFLEKKRRIYFALFIVFGDHEEKYLMNKWKTKEIGIRKS